MSEENTARAGGETEVERLTRERDRFWGLLCETVEALGCVAPEAVQRLDAGLALKQRRLRAVGR